LVEVVPVFGWVLEGSAAWTLKGSRGRTLERRRKGRRIRERFSEEENGLGEMLLASSPAAAGARVGENLLELLFLFWREILLGREPGFPSLRGALSEARHHHDKGALAKVRVLDAGGGMESALRVCFGETRGCEGEDLTAHLVAVGRTCI
jgi:hypothetical protein